MRTNLKRLLIGGTVIGIGAALAIAVELSGIKPKVRGFQGIDPNFTPLFVEINLGHPEVKAGTGTNTPQVGYVHRSYTLTDRAQSIGVVRYRIGRITEWLGLGGWAEATSMASSGWSTNRSTLLRVGYRAKEMVVFQEAVLVSENGQRLPLTPGVGITLRPRTEHLDEWTLPYLLTNRGTYRLFLPGSGRTLLSFRYE